MHTKNGVSEILALQVLYKKEEPCTNLRVTVACERGWVVGDNIQK